MKDWDRDHVTSIILRVGVIGSLFFIIFGLVLLFVKGHADGYSLSQISTITSNKVTSGVLNLGDIISGSIALNPLYLIALGLWILIFTPVSVVFVALIEFIQEKNYSYVLMSLYVLCILLIAIIVL
ncbi:MAG: DUF1634 domain-containing protein [Candidatus Thermoplasmatota archaeon]|nr:DUF1634 domain-containing protein [Candidatus Thermoplasmatota archaeon]